MANSLFANGFAQYAGTGSSPTYEQVRMMIQSTNTTPIFYGDPVTMASSGYITQLASNSVIIAGIFVGCEYLSVAQKRKVWSNYWPGSDNNGDVTAYVVNDPNAQFQVQTANSNTTATAVGIGNIGNNIGIGYSTGTGAGTNALGNSNGIVANGLSTAYADQYTIATTATLPFKIVGLIDYAVTGTSPFSTINGYDSTTAYNRIIVALNNVVTKTLTGI